MKQPEGGPGIILPSRYQIKSKQKNYFFALSGLEFRLVPKLISWLLLVSLRFIYLIPECLFTGSFSSLMQIFFCITCTILDYDLIIYFLSVRILETLQH